MDLVKVLQNLYDSEINVTVSWLWDGGFDFWLTTVGGANNENRRGTVYAAEDLAKALHEAALAEYPESRYARRDGEGS